MRRKASPSSSSAGRSVTANFLTMNTAHLIPKRCISPIIIRADEHPDLPFFGGTGFFVYFPPYKNIYFLTARHCIYDQDGTIKGKVEVKLNDDSNCNLAVPFNEHLMVLESNPPSEFEDVVALTVGPLSEVEQEELFDRALRLPDQSDADLLLNNLVTLRGKVRTVGYPGASKEIDYDKNHATVQPRGIVGTVTKKSSDEKMFTVEELNWKDGEISGFSGSPVIEFVPGQQGEIVALPIGILLTGTKNEIFKFLNINIATNLISEWIIESGIA